jgi:hypothetical protein
MRTFALATLCVASAAAAAPAPTPLLSLKSPPGQFVDDPFAVRDDGAALAYLTTNGTDESLLHLQPLPSGPEIKVAGAPLGASRLYWLGKDKVLIVSHDADKGTTTAQVFSSKGPERGERLGPVTEVALGQVGGKPAVLTFTKSEKSHVEYTVAAYTREGLRPLGKKVLREDRDGRIPTAAGGLRALWWTDGFATLAAMKAGEFDKARDMRRPDRFTRLDVFTGRTGEEREIEDVLGFAHVAADHRPRGSSEVFVHVTDDHAKLELVDGVEEHEIALERPLWMYDFQTLAFQPLDGDRLALSLTVDPVNPQAVKRQKADVDEIDLYNVDRKTRAVSLRLRVPGEGRPSAWHQAGGRAAILRKGKGFDRGGVALDVYDLPK